MKIIIELIRKGASATKGKTNPSMKEFLDIHSITKVIKNESST